MKFKDEYSTLLHSKDEAMDFISDGDRIMTYGGSTVFLDALCQRYKRLRDVEVYTMFLLSKNYPFLTGETEGHIKHYATFVSPSVRAALKDGHSPEVIITHYSDTDRMVLERIRPTVLFTQVTPMDKDGFFTMGFNSLGFQAAIEMADKVIVQVNPRLPKILGDCNRLHISKVSAIFEEEASVHTAPREVFDEDDIRAANYVVERIPNEATLQIGVGRIPDAVGTLLQNHRDLGIHTEMFSVSLMNLMKKGIINNSKKALEPGKTIFAFAGGARATQEIYDYVDNNEQIEMRPISWVNDPYVIAQNNKFISINSALAVDLTGQVCSESIGLQTFSGTGGQLDFVRGAKMARDGQSFVLMRSVAEKKDGTRISKISLALPLGSAVTTPRADVDKIVTEYGVAELRCKSLYERAKSLINIAHPDFRDQLRFEARRAGYGV